LVSVILVNWNGQRYAERCLSTLKVTDYPEFEIIFVDNGSCDYSLLMAQKILPGGPSSTIIRNAENLGFGEANNQGIPKSKGQYLAFLNVDTEVE